MSETLLSGSHLSSGYGSVRAMWDVDLEVKRGEVTCVLGPNGAGKTTLCLAVAGALRCWEGQIHLGGEDVTNQTPEARARSGIGHVPQGRRVFPDLTVDENLEVARFAAGGRASVETEWFVYELFPKLTELKKATAGRLSGGEQQMLAVGRALMTEPQLLVLDEPSLGLAPLLVNNLYSAIARIRDRGVSILLVEQAVSAALGVADQVTILESGRTVDSGPVASFDEAAIARAYMGGGTVGG